MQVEIKISPQDFIVGFVEAIKDPEVASILKGLFVDAAQASANTTTPQKHDPSEPLQILDFIARYGNTYGGEQTLRNRCRRHKDDPNHLKHSRTGQNSGHYLICLKDVRGY